MLEVSLGIWGIPISLIHLLYICYMYMYIHMQVIDRSDEHKLPNTGMNFSDCKWQPISEQGQWRSGEGVSAWFQSLGLVYHQSTETGLQPTQRTWPALMYQVYGSVARCWINGQWDRLDAHVLCQMAKGSMGRAAVTNILKCSRRVGLWHILLQLEENRVGGHEQGLKEHECGDWKVCRGGDVGY